MIQRTSSLLLITAWGIIFASIHTFAQKTPINPNQSADMGAETAGAPIGKSIQEITGQLEPEELILYRIPRLYAGNRLYVRAVGTSLNLDPFIGLLDSQSDFQLLRESFRAEVKGALDAGRDPLQIIPELAGKYFLVWNDDIGESYSAGFEYTIPKTGAYRLLVRSTLANTTFGKFRLLIGVNAPEVMTGTAKARGNPIARLEEIGTSEIHAIEQRESKITDLAQSRRFDLRDIRAGDTVYAFVEATSGDLKPLLFLEDFGGKPVVSGNYSGQSTQASLEYTFSRDVQRYRLTVSGSSSSSPATTGDFRLLAGINAPEVLSGSAEIKGGEVFRAPIVVKVGIKLHQITGVNQKAKSFSVIAVTAMRWQDSALAFSPESCQCEFKTFRGDSFNSFVSAAGATWPDYVLANQSANRFVQNRSVVVYPIGEVIYLEKFSTTLQAANFDFRKFPFDVQQFPIQVDSIFPERFFVYAPMEGFSGAGNELGDEEWQVIKYDTDVSTQTENIGIDTSRFTFSVQAGRRINYYIFRLFLPILIILSVSWVAVLLKDYSKRVDVANANLLLFMAFNFTIASDLPRLGYLTFMDNILIGAFLATGIVVILNIYVKKMHLAGNQAQVERIDRHLVWAYPAFYVLTVLVFALLFG